MSLEKKTKIIAGAVGWAGGVLLGYHIGESIIDSMKLSNDINNIIMPASIAFIGVTGLVIGVNIPDLYYRIKEICQKYKK